MSYCNKSNLTTSETTRIVFDRFSLWPAKAGTQHPKASNRKTGILGASDVVVLIALPLVQLEEGENPRYIVSTGLSGMGIGVYLIKVL